jgi:hypothetical protein
MGWLSPGLPDLLGLTIPEFEVDQQRRVRADTHVLVERDVLANAGRARIDRTLPQVTRAAPDWKSHLAALRAVVVDVTTGCERIRHRRPQGRSGGRCRSGRC